MATTPLTFKRYLYTKIDWKAQGLSFREYLHLCAGIQAPEFTLDELFTKHVSIASSFSSVPILKYFQDYLLHGYYPFFMEKAIF